MAYGDYGGRSYLHGTSQDDMVDVVAPGEPAGPGGSLSSQYHALLGRGPIRVGLYKTSSVTILRDGVEVPLCSVLMDRDDAPEEVDPDGDYLDPSPWAEAGRVASFAVDGHRIDVFWDRAHRHFVHARLLQPNGNAWTGWSGFGAGAGHTEENSQIEGERVAATGAAFDAIEPDLPPHPAP